VVEIICPGIPENAARSSEGKMSANRAKETQKEIVARTPKFILLLHFPDAKNEPSKARL